MPGMDVGAIRIGVYEIERYATEDGPGIRTVVFFKGCNLRCTWCQNPESQDPKPQIMYYGNLCIKCGRCVVACPEEAIVGTEAGFLTDHDKCTRCGTCVTACLTGARELVGRSMSVDAVFAEILKDRQFYEESGGGVTFSGGEPLLQALGVIALAERCRHERIHVALETAVHVPWESIEGVLDQVDLIYIDLKHIDPANHRRFTGVTNELILDNIARASMLRPDLVVRIPVVPGVNHDSDTQERMFRFLQRSTEVRTVELLPYHRLGLAKYQGIGMRYVMGDAPNLGAGDCEPYAEIGRALGLNVRVGAG